MSTTNKPPIGVMPRRVWEEHRISALAEAIVRFMRPVHPSVPTVFDLSHVRDWAAEIVELCERHGRQEHAASGLGKPSDGEASQDHALKVLDEWLRVDYRGFACYDTIVVALDGKCLGPVAKAPTLAALANKLAEKEDKP